jgi:DNA-nicking Smr family endonuclease
MVRKKKGKRKGRLQAEKGSHPREIPFNPALQYLGELKQEQGTAAGVSEKPVLPVLPQDTDDMARFREAMTDVTPLKGTQQRVARLPDRDARPVHPPNAGDLEVLAHLSDLVSGMAEMDITFSDEYIEGSVKGFDRKLMQKLKDGLFPVQDHMDLHGCTRQEAELKVTEFLLRSHRLGLRCVLVVHGRGLNSEDHIPVLKERLPIWLNRGPVKRIVLAFSTARPYDGGTGAIYILLRRPRGSF